MVGLFGMGARSSRSLSIVVKFKVVAQPLNEIRFAATIEEIRILFLVVKKTMRRSIGVKDKAQDMK